MERVNAKASAGLLGLLIVVAACLFFSAGTLDYWQAWVFLAVFFVPEVAITGYLMRKDPRLLERRVRAGPVAEKETRQKIIQLVASLSFVGMMILPGLDHRFGWSAVPPYVAIVGDGLVALGFFGVFLVFKENTFASAVIEIGAEQRVVSTGPYAIVRHPMYAAALVLIPGVPLALGSWWGLLTIIPITAAIVLRLLDEERFLTNNLPGYREYQQTVRYRLAPFVW